MFPGLEVGKVNPASVAAFMKSLKPGRLKPTLPMLLSQSKLKTEERLKALLNYCQKENKLELPLLLTHDNILRVFKEKVFSSTFFDLVPEQSNLFLHQSLRFMSSSFKDFVKDFQFDDLVGFERFAKEAMKDPAWLQLFWEFVSDRMSNSPLTPETVVSKIPHWRVLPVKKPGSVIENSLFQIQDAKLAIYLSEPVGFEQPKMSKILKKLNCLQLNPPSVELSSTLAKFSSTLIDFEGLTRILTSLDLSLLGPSDHRIVLSYFENQAPKLSNDSIERLRSLPLYETYDGLKVSLVRGNFRILHANFPKGGFEATQHGLTFLKHDHSLSKLHKRLGLTEIGELEVYLSYILDMFKNMTDEALLQHLAHLSPQLSNQQGKEVIIINRLRSMPIIGPRGNRKCASNFYSHKNDFFQKMLSKEIILPNEYHGNLFEFCKLIGLQCDVSDQLFLDVANDLANSGTAVEEKAKYLVNYLVQKDGKWPVYFLQQLSSIRFIPAHQIPAHLQNLHAQFMSGKLICFKDSVPCSSQHLVWTSVNLLPLWATPHSLGLTKSLEINNQPTLEKVFLHCRTLCNDLAKRKSSETTENENSAQSCSTLTGVMRNIYHFLMKNNNDIEIQTALKDVACIVVEDGRRLVFPHQVSIEMIENDLRPHLFKLPLELGEFHSFFCKLGATVKPTLKQLSDVLKAIYDTSKERKLNPEENRLSITAIQRFFACLRNIEQANYVGIEALYFLTKDGSLTNTNSLTFNDRQKFADRVKDYDCEDPGTYRLNLKDLQALPEKLRPKFLSELVTEKLHPGLSESCESHDLSCSLKNHFDLLLSDLKFRQGITRLSKHFCSKSGVKFDEIEMRSKLKQIGSIFIECRPQLQTLLFNTKKFEDIPSSEKSRKVFVDESKCIFLNHKNKRIYKLAECLTSLITKILDNYVSEEGKSIVQAILNLEFTLEIEDLLNDEDISFEPNISIKKMNLEPGDLIDDEFLSFMTQNPSHYFKEGELVGYLQNDIYILARIVSETGTHTSTGNYNFNRKYKIDLGDNRVTTFFFLIFISFFRLQ